jgi:hypothetical protein
MTDDDLAQEFRDLIWRDRPAHRRYATATEMIARTLALREAVDFAQHRERLMSRARELIASRAGFARYRLASQ